VDAHWLFHIVTGETATPFPGRFGLRVGEILGGADLAQMQLLDVVVADYLRDMQGGGIRTLLALHRRFPRSSKAPA
jgi:hypothetical protein